MSETIKKHYRACHLCEAICGLEITTQGSEILSIKGDSKDPMSKGYICPKATAIADIHKDPDRLRKPVKRVADGWQEISWQEAIDITAKNLVDAQLKHGQDAVGFYAGNPGVHNYGNLTHGSLLRKVVKTRNNFSATSLDQLPHQLVSYAMYGHQFFIPVPDIDHTQLMVILGGNPIASNGSMMTMPNGPKRFKALQERGGKLIVIDPRRSETADIADQHIFVRPGNDAYVLMAMINLLFSENWVSNNHISEHLENVDILRNAASPFSLELAEQRSGIPAQTIKDLTQQLANTDKAVMYGRMGVSVQEFGTVCQWAIQVINILIGAFDTVGGSLISSPAFGYVRKGSNGAGHFDLFRSRVSAYPEFSGELPAAAMAEEILTPGEGQIKAMVTIAGNPIIASVNSSELKTAFEALDFYVAFDFYINATTCHADIILPPTSSIEHDHYDIAFHRLAVRNSARQNPAIFEPEEGTMHDWEIFNALSAKIAEIKSIDFKPLPAPDQLVRHGIDNGELGLKRNPQIALTFDKVLAAPHGIDLGPLTPSAIERIPSENGLINCAPDFIVADLQRLKQRADDAQQATPPEHNLLLIGRRHVRSNNSWMHNYHRLVKGKPRWQLMMHPDDLTSRGLKDQSEVTITSRVGSVTTTVIATDELMPGVVSLPHGWGHQRHNVKMAIAAKQQGSNCNELTDDKLLDTVSGNAALNGVPVQVRSAQHA